MNLRARALVGIGPVVAPVALVLAMKVVMGLGPAASPAADAAPDAAAAGAAVARARPTAEQIAALAWLAQNPASADLPSPFNQPTPPPEPVAAEPEPAPKAPEPETAPAPDPLAGLKLTAILAAGDAQLAVMNGEVYRIGQTLPGGLRLVCVDSRGQRVELAGADGTRHWLSRQK